VIRKPLDCVVSPASRLRNCSAFSGVSVIPGVSGYIAPILDPIIKPILRPITRLLVGLIAIPMFRLFRRRVIRVHELDAEMEKDIDQWFRAAILMLLATENMEPRIFFWTAPHAQMDPVGGFHIDHWGTALFRLIVTIGAIEKMPDQTLFAIIHPGMERVKFQRGLGLFRNLWRQKLSILQGAICQHLNRSSPVFAILATLLGGPIGWTFYGLAVTQYLIIGLVTSRDKAVDVLSEFDRRVAAKRSELESELTHFSADGSKSEHAAVTSNVIVTQSPAD
jgi:hypothetical protein